MVQRFPNRPITGGTNNGTRPMRYDYWRTGYGPKIPPNLDFYVAMAGEFHCKPNYTIGNSEYTHQTQIFYHLAGSATLEYSGQTASVSRGRLFVIPPYHPFTYSSHWKIKYHWLALEGSWPRPFGELRVIFYPLDYDAEIEARLIDLREGLILRKPGYALRSVGVFYELMARVEEISNSASLPESSYPEAVRNAIIFIRENYAMPFNAAQTADTVGLSQSHLRALFEKWVGEPPKRFHTRCRIDQAKRLLSEQRLSVFEVAFHLGFADVHHFSRVFKQMTGIAPSYYAELQHNNAGQNRLRP